jgi:hypothetical protein
LHGDPRLKPAQGDAEVPDMRTLAHRAVLVGRPSGVAVSASSGRRMRSRATRAPNPAERRASRAFVRGLLAAISACTALTVTAIPASAFNVEVVNNSGQPSQNVYVMLEKASSSDGQLTNEVGKRLSEITNSTFSINEIHGGRVYVSFGAPVKVNEPDNAPTRYDKIELSGGYPDGVADLTAVDFFAIPFDLQAFDSSGAPLGSPLTYSCYTSTILRKLRALAPSAEVTSGGQFVRFLSPSHAPSSYPSMAPYVQSMAGQTIHINDVYANAEHPPTLELEYSGEFQADGSIELTGTITREGKVEPGEPVEVEGSTLPLAIYTADGPFTVNKKEANVGENNQYSVIYRDLTAGFALGYWGGKYGNDTSAWRGQPDLAAARASVAPYPTYDEYQAIIDEYSSAYGSPFNELGPTPITVPTESSEETLRLTIDPDQGPNTPACVGGSSPSSAGGGGTAGNSPAAKALLGRAPVAPSSTRTRVTIDSRKVTLDKRGSAPIELGCTGGACRGELTLSRRYVRRRRGRRGKLAAVHTVVLGTVKFSIAGGRVQRIWVNLNGQALRSIESAGRHGLVAVASATLGPGPKPALAGSRPVTLVPYTPPRRRRHTSRN